MLCQGEGRGRGRDFSVFGGGFRCRDYSGFGGEQVDSAWVGAIGRGRRLRCFAFAFQVQLLVEHSQEHLAGVR